LDPVDLGRRGADEFGKLGNGGVVAHGCGGGRGWRWRGLRWSGRRSGGAPGC
jgi:hypothetical protein